MNSNYYVIVKSNNRTGKVGMASIRDVARRAGVGVGTVSRVINGTGYVSADTRKKIESAIEELQYKPNELARNLFRNKTGIVGILVPDVDHPFFSSYVRQTEAALYEMGYKTLIGNTIGISNREREFLDMLDRNMVDGIITGSHTLEGDEYLKRKKTIVSLDRDFGSGIPMVGSDHMSGGEMAANILIENKCKKVLNISGVAPDIAANDRHAILETILTEHGVEVIDVIMEWNKFGHEDYREIARKAMQKCDGIDGVFGTDQPALYYMHLAMEAGRKVPDNFRVVTYDGTDITRLCYPEATSICQNIEMLAEISANSVVDLIEERRPVPHKQIIPVEVRQGQTTYPVDL